MASPEFDTYELQYKAALLFWAKQPQSNKEHVTKTQQDSAVYQRAGYETINL